MKHLRQYIRNILLTEAMKPMTQLPTGTIIAIDDDGNNVSIYYAQTTNNTNLSDDIHGQIDFLPAFDLITPDPDKNQNQGTCEDAYVVQNSEADKGWGPLLYDIAIEYATMKGSGLMCDRRTISVDALKIWDTYMHTRTDVTKFQCDNNENTLTPQRADNIDQSVAGEDSNASSWKSSSLSKRYSKPPVTITYLKRQGKLVMI